MTRALTGRLPSRPEEMATKSARPDLLARAVTVEVLHSRLPR